jgi:hypothetical protein
MAICFGRHVSQLAATPRVRQQGVSRFSALACLNLQHQRRRRWIWWGRWRLRVATTLWTLSFWALAMPGLWPPCAWRAENGGCALLSSVTTINSWNASGYRKVLWLKFRRAFLQFRHSSQGPLLNSSAATLPRSLRTNDAFGWLPTSNSGKSLSIRPSTRWVQALTWTVFAVPPRTPIVSSRGTVHGPRRPSGLGYGRPPIDQCVSPRSAAPRPGSRSQARLKPLGRTLR